MKRNENGFPIISWIFRLPTSLVFLHQELPFLSLGDVSQNLLMASQRLPIEDRAINRWLLISKWTKRRRKRVRACHKRLSVGLIKSQRSCQQTVRRSRSLSITFSCFLRSALLCVGQQMKRQEPTHRKELWSKGNDLLMNAFSFSFLLLQQNNEKKRKAFIGDHLRNIPFH